MSVTRVIQDCRSSANESKIYVSQYLAFRAMTDHGTENGLINTIRFVANSLYKADGENRQHEWQNIINRMCDLSVKNLGSHMILALLQYEAQQPDPSLALDHSRVILSAIAPRLIHSTSDDSAEVESNLLVCAALLGDLEMVKYLLERVGDFQPWSNCFGYAASAAAAGGHGQILNMLIDRKCYYNDTYLDPLVAASWRSHPDIVRLLLKAGSDILLWFDRNQASIEAARAGHAENMRLIIDREHRTTFSYRCFRAAAQYGHENIVSLFLDKSFKCASEIGIDAAFEAAARHGQNHILRMLLEHQHSSRSYLLSLYLEEAAISGFKSSARILLDAGANINYQHSPEGFPPMLVAAVAGHPHMIEFFLENGADLNNDSRSRRGLKDAKSAGHKSTVRMLIELGVDLEKALNEAYEEDEDDG